MPNISGVSAKCSECSQQTCHTNDEGNLSSHRQEVWILSLDFWTPQHKYWYYLPTVNIARKQVRVQMNKPHMIDGL